MRNIILMLFSAIVLGWFICPPIQALDEDSEVFGFIPEDAGIVMALDIDELMAYGRSVGDDWRDADQAHFIESLGLLSDLATREAGKPDILWFFENIGGVVAVSMNPEGNFPLLAFQAARSGDGEFLERYTLAYVAEKHFQEIIMSVKSAINSYYYRGIEDPDNPDEYIYPYEYPESLDILVEEGLLDEIPDNPYTGEPMEILDSDENPSLGDIAYIPSTSTDCGGCCSMEPDEDAEPKIRSFRLVAFRIGGIHTFEGWKSNWVPYNNFEWQLRTEMDDIDVSAIGFNMETDGDWTFYERTDGDYAFVASDDYIVFGPDSVTLTDSVDCFMNDEGFHFNPPEGFDTEGAFYRDQTDFSVMEMPMMCPMECMPTDVPAEIMEIISDAMSNLGWEAFESDNTAGWLGDGDIHSMQWTVLSGEATRTPVGLLAYADPEILMTAEDGPFTLIGELAWANPGEYLQAVMDTVFEYVLPIVGAEMGEDIDPTETLAMFGMSELDPGMIDQVYILFTESTDRGDGLYIPGLTVVAKTESTDLAYMGVGLIDTMTLLAGLPMHSADYDDPNSHTWLMDHPDCPISPTIAWTDGWIVKSLFREDALTAVEALESGELLRPDGMGPANSRMSMNRQQLMRGLADIMYVIPEEGVPAAGAVLELAAQLSGPDERLEASITSHGDYYIQESRFSIGLFEDLVPVFMYVIKAFGESDYH